MRSPPDMRHLALKRKYFRKNLTIFEMFANCQIVCIVCAHNNNVWRKFYRNKDNDRYRSISSATSLLLSSFPRRLVQIPEVPRREDEYYSGTTKDRHWVQVSPPRGGRGGGWIHKNESSSTLPIPLLPQF